MDAVREDSNSANLSPTVVAYDRGSPGDPMTTRGQRNRTSIRHAKHRHLNFVKGSQARISKRNSPG